jgi:uncharacterized protein
VRKNVTLHLKFVQKNVIMKREIYQKMLEWKQSKNRKPLILNGARQVGKTWLLKTFATNEYKKVAYVSCDKNKDIQDLFTENYETTRIIRGISAITRVDIEPDNTLIILDEVQSVPSAISSLKYFCEDAPQYHIAVAGSLLGISFHNGYSFPVGKVDMIRVYPMTYEEFLLAKGNSRLLDVLLSRDYKLINDLRMQYIDLLRQYYFTGGMPAAVLAYINDEGLNQVRAIQKQILFDYSQDFSKHAPNQEVPRIDLVWQNIPSQLAKDNKKFIYGAMKKGARASEFELAIQWLINAGLIYKINRVKEPVMPLKFYEDMSAFKLFMLDCGLMGAMADTPASQILIGDSIFKEYKGSFTELYVLQQIKAMDTVPVYYFSTDDSHVEVDFVVQCGASIIPIEVKAEENLRAKSLRKYVSDNPQLKGIRFSMSPYRDQEWMKNIPLFAVTAELKSIIDES